MAKGILDTTVNYERQTTNATVAVVIHDVSGLFFGNDAWGHWTIRATARKVGLSVCAHFYQRISGIWTSGTGMIYTGTQPSMESEKSPALSTTNLALVGSNDIEMWLTGVAATNLNWLVSVTTHNAYTEADV